MLIPILLFILGLICLIKGGDWFVDGAVGVAERFNVPDIIIGATVVSIGTTLPEVMVSAGSAMSGHGEIAYGNALGSIICNTALIAALTIAIRPSKVAKKSLRTPVCFYFVATAIYAVNAYVFGYFGRVTGVILLTVFVIYMWNLVRQARSGKSEGDAEAPVENEKSPIENAEASDADKGTSFAAEDDKDEELLELDEELKEKEELSKIEEKVGDSIVKQLILLIGGAAVIAIGADLLVDNGTLIAQWMGVPESVIALTFVALGTSLPELVTAISSLAKGHSALSLGNIVGANIFNLVLVSGMACTIGPYSVPVEKTVTLGGSILNASLVIDIPLIFILMGLLTLPAVKTGELKRWVGVVLLIAYFAFIIFQFVG